MPEDQACPGCGGTGLTDHTEHSVETDEDGQQKPVVRSWIGSCSVCNGTGVVT
ncbi:hypothetical protein RKE29_28180 [Streptomyces sp. B1866]|uniref:hypothetical protein n=1 Tax=Streptomyces sp. B1866 TaxID=3075431 RepID=UPI0028910095|nr:hypothetical protein [Streptomyces sp. B1866]MDT3400441.1 hypothetical protein [Streptomyces sp. B1866]